ncbi:MAG TPA: lytic transglycosylase domain-containing protein [Thermodesulfobacteriota bacterium]|nr:lytic transglycosylase domain-containing protein [Thermodesulfobacteriota bacterium]
MKRDRNEKSPVVWRNVHEKSKKRWKTNFFLMNLFYAVIVLSMGYWFVEEQKSKDFITLQRQELQTLKTKENIYLILRNRGVSLSQGLDIADVTIRQSRELDLSMSLILAVMKKENMVTPDIRSSQNAVGLMQVRPVIWEEYVSKLNLKGSAYEVVDPVKNTIVATHVLKDLYEHYKKIARSEEEIWRSVLSAYYTGMTSFSQTEMAEPYNKYVADVNRFKKEFDEKLQN